MSYRPSMESATGTIEDVAAFFKVTRYAVMEWMKEKPPLRAFNHGRTVRFHMDSVVEFWVANEKHGLEPGEAKRRTEKAWLEHMKQRDREKMFEEFDQRITNLEKLNQLVQRGEPIAIAIKQEEAA